MQDETQLSGLLTGTSTGKRVHEHNYVHISAIPTLSPDQQSNISQAAEFAKLKPESDFNVVKLHRDGDELSLLCYPTFFDDPFPTLARSWRLSLSRRALVFRNYEDSRNPPILHRKELLLPPADPRIPGFSSITQSAESLGLFDEPNRIGFREHWYRLIAEHGYELVGHEFLPLANAATSDIDIVPISADGVQRHLTALSRQNFSAPVQALSRHGLIGPGVTFFDYGCGRGDDVRGLIANGVDASGWDPHFANESDKRVADVVNIGFVINVIEDIDERVEALRGAYAHTSGVLSVAAMLSSEAKPEGRLFRDGYMTSRNTFQKYFTQAQLRDFIEHTLDEVAIAAGPGVFLVFRNKNLEQTFLARRYGHRAPTILSRGWIREKPLREKIPRLDRETRLFDEHRELFDRLWLKLLERGRILDKAEVENIAELEAVTGTLNKALRLVQSRFDIRELDIARTERTCDILVLLAMQQFEKRKPYRHLEAQLQRDIRSFFGGYGSARELAKKALFELGDIDAIDRACREAAEKGLGWLEDSQSLQLHISLIERLPIALRIYVGCATVLCGDISEFDLVKIHIRSGKATLLKFVDFDNSPLPRLLQRVKVKLRDQEMDVFNYGTEYPSTLLYRKSRFINEEYPHYAEQCSFEEALENLRICDFSGYGPSELELRQRLEQSRWEIDGFNLIRSRRIPDLEEFCGAHLTYRHLVECGETQAKTQLPNLPKEPDSYTALFELTRNVLDPVIEYFGMVKLSYGFCSPDLARKIAAGIAPKLDQHACCEKDRRGRSICPRSGAAVDFLVQDENMGDVAKWVINHLPFDRLYYYGHARPIHVSFGPDSSKAVFTIVNTANGYGMPRRGLILETDE
ncbi:MAG: DNA phosphorothioation-associated putative methyltransferase [Betaproteobacteria bacterium]